MIPPPTPSVLRRFRFGLLFFGIVFGLLAGEVLVRILGGTDEDGNFWFCGTRIGPLQPPLARLTTLVDDLGTKGEESRLVYHSSLGWTWRPGASLDHPPCTIDERGNRKRPPTAPDRDASIIALYGDSATFGAEVPYEESWGHQLEELLAHAGKERLVVNLGVGGYGMGQAYLRWRSTHAELRPEIVVFGLQPENVFRNVNIIRAFYMPDTGLVFSKPRFVLDGDGLAVVNIPCLPPREVLRVLREPRSWEHRRLETFYVENGLESTYWRHFRLASLVADRLGSSPLAKRRADCFREDSEAFQVSVRIIQKFCDDVRAVGSQFVIVHLPQLEDLSILRDGRPPPYAGLLAELERRGMTIVDPTDELLEIAEHEGLPGLFQPLTHYGPSANRVVAEVLAVHL